MEHCQSSSGRVDPATTGVLLVGENARSGAVRVADRGAAIQDVGPTVRPTSRSGDLTGIELGEFSDDWAPGRDPQRPLFQPLRTVLQPADRRSVFEFVTR